MITRNFDIMVRIPEQGYIPLCFQLVQNDKDVYGLTIHITDGVTEIDYSQILRATIAFSKSDGTVVQGNLTKGAGGAFTYTMGTNEIACPGDVLTSIQLIGAANERLTTARFKFNVVRDLITPSAVQSVSEFAILQQLVEDVNQLKQDIVNLQVPDNSLMDTKLSGAAGQIKTRFADHVTDFDALAAEVTALKADNTAHNGFAGRAKDLSELTDFNTFTATGLYHGVLISEIANEPITTALARRITLINMAAPDGDAAMQMLIYVDGYNAGNLYVRSQQGIWSHIASV